MNILYVEDDPLLRRQILHELLKENHDVIEACDGTEACWLLNYHRGDLDLLITDVDLGTGLDGWLVAEHARMLADDIGVIYATGVQTDHQPIQSSVMLAKPFSLASLQSAITRASTLSGGVH
ncbi:MAG: response regulator [Sphingomonadaceae bacterium]